MGPTTAPGRSAAPIVSSTSAETGTPSPSEGCDDGNTVSGDGCSASCFSESCGNDIVDGQEECDDGANGDQDDGCTDLCRLPTCGDGFEQANEGEMCDDSNNNNTDGCVQGCVLATCGDGFTWSGHEDCDDANADNNDACLVGCIAAWCGDGYLRVGVEDCDDGNNGDGDGCNSTCGEEAGWSCTPDGCSTVCGDGIVVGVECCDDGNLVDGDSCPSNCALTDRRVFSSSTVPQRRLRGRGGCGRVLPGFGDRRWARRRFCCVGLHEYDLSRKRLGADSRVRRPVPTRRRDTRCE